MSSLLETRELHKRYGSNFYAVNNINLSLENGKIIGLLGPNGSGKTTLIKMITGLLQPTHGELFIDGKNPSPETKALISYLPDRNYFNKTWTVIDTLTYFEDFYKDFNREKAIHMLNSLNIPGDIQIKSLSKGMIEKLQLILVMSRDAKLYILDEPLAGVDPASRDYILHTIVSNYNPESTILLSTHLITDIENILDEVIFIQNGSIRVHKSVESIREDEKKSVDAYFREVFACFQN